MVAHLNRSLLLQDRQLLRGHVGRVERSVVFEQILLCLLKNVICKEVPEVKADLEQFFLAGNVRHLDDVLEALLGVVAQGVDVRVGLGDVAGLLDQADVLF